MATHLLSQKVDLLSSNHHNYYQVKRTKENLSLEVLMTAFTSHEILSGEILSYTSSIVYNPPLTHML